MVVKEYFTMERASQRTGLSHLEAFVAVAERRSFSAAARALAVSTSAVSQAVRRLEAEIGAPLFARTTRSVHPTDVGDRLLREAGGAVRQAAEALARARASEGAVTGTLRLNVARIALPTLRPLLVDYLAAHPHVDVEVSVDDRFVDIVRGGFDAGVRLGEAVAQDMVAVPLGKPWRFVIVAAPSYLRARGVPRRPEDLAAHDCIGFRGPSSGALYRWELERRGEARVVAVRGRVVCDDGEALRLAALDGLGLAYLPEATVEPSVRAGELTVVLEGWAPTGPGLTLYFPRRAQTLPKLRAFLDVVRARRRRR